MLDGESLVLDSLKERRRRWCAQRRAHGVDGTEHADSLASGAPTLLASYFEGLPVLALAWRLAVPRRWPSNGLLRGLGGPDGRDLRPLDHRLHGQHLRDDRGDRYSRVLLDHDVSLRGDRYAAGARGAPPGCACRCCIGGGFPLRDWARAWPRTRRPLRRRLLTSPSSPPRTARSSRCASRPTRAAPACEAREGEPSVLPVRRRSALRSAKAERQHLRRQTVRSVTWRRLGCGARDDLLCRASRRAARLLLPADAAEDQCGDRGNCYTIAAVARFSDPDVRPVILADGAHGGARGALRRPGRRCPSA